MFQPEGYITSLCYILFCIFSSCFSVPDSELSTVCLSMEVAVNLFWHHIAMYVHRASKHILVPQVFGFTKKFIPMFGKLWGLRGNAKGTLIQQKVSTV